MLSLAFTFYALFYFISEGWRPIFILDEILQINMIMQFGSSAGRDIKDVSHLRLSNQPSSSQHRSLPFTILILNHYSHSSLAWPHLSLS